MNQSKFPFEEFVKTIIVNGTSAINQTTREAGGFWAERTPALERASQSVCVARLPDFVVG